MDGRKPKPIPRQIAEGDTRKIGKHKLEERLASVPKGGRGLPDCPRHLSGRARFAWNLLRSELETMELDAKVDALALEALCANYATSVRAHLKIQKQGEVIEDPIVSRDTGKIIGYRAKKNPWLPIREHAHRLLLSFASEFGISPASRTRLSVAPRELYSDEEVQAVLSGPTLTDEEKARMQ